MHMTVSVGSTILITHFFLYQNSVDEQVMYPWVKFDGYSSDSTDKNASEIEGLVMPPASLKHTCVLNRYRINYKRNR